MQQHQRPALQKLRLLVAKAEVLTSIEWVKVLMEVDWAAYAAVRARDTTVMARQILKCLREQSLGQEQTSALLRQLEYGSTALGQIVPVMHAQGADDVTIRLVTSLQVTWSRLISLVARYQRLMDPIKPPPHLHLVDLMRAQNQDTANDAGQLEETGLLLQRQLA